MDVPRGRGSGSRDFQGEFRNRLIQSRLTPNAISLTGFFLCLVSAGLILEGWWIALSTYAVLETTLLLLIQIGDARRDALDPRKEREGEAQ